MAKNFDQTETVTDTKLDSRDSRLIPPEDFIFCGQKPNFRLYDIYQTGILFYRIIENGEWPFDSSYEYGQKNCKIRKFICHLEDMGIGKTMDLISGMIEIEPDHRVETMEQIEAELKEILSSI